MVFFDDYVHYMSSLAREYLPGVPSQWDLSAEGLYIPRASTLNNLCDLNCFGGLCGKKFSHAFV